MGRAKPLHLRLFLEGQEVPVVSAQVSINMFAPAAAAIQIVPIDEGMDFKPRTMVHLFFLEEPLVELNVDGEGGLRRSPLTHGDPRVADGMYKLLFCGEIVGFSLVKQPMARALILQCLDFSSYWDFTQATMLDWNPGGNALFNRASLYGSEALFSNLPTQHPEQKLSGWIKGKPKTPGLQNVGGLAGGIIHMMEIMGGTLGEGGQPHRLGYNDFFTIAQLRCRIMEQVTAEENDNTAQNLFDVNVFYHWLLNSLQSIGPQITIRDLFKLLCQFIYYGIAPNPAAKFENYDGFEQVVIPPRVISLTSNTYIRSANAFLTDALGILDAYSVTAQVVEDAALKIRLAKQALSPQNVKELTAEDTKPLGDIEVLMEDLKRGITSPTTWTTESKSQSVDSKVRLVKDAITKFQTKLRAIVNGHKPRREPGRTEVVPAKNRLKTQIFRPDCYMAAPPVCNVVFPEMYSALNYDRNFLAEVTRLEVAYHVALLPPDRLTANYVLAPQIWGQAAKVVEVLKNRYRVLMDHELHTGMVVRQEWLSDFFSGIKSSIPSNADPQRLPDFAQNWQKTTALFHFFKYRIGPRTLNSSGRFNPYMVAGFPGLVIQRPFFDANPKFSEEEVLGKLQTSTFDSDITPPPQFLGMVEGIQHSIGQDGGNTTFSMSHCRLHRGSDDDFINAVLESYVKSETYNTRINYVLNATELAGDVAKNADAGKKLAFLVKCTPQTDAAPPKTKVKKNREGEERTDTDYSDSRTMEASEPWLDKGAPVRVPKSGKRPTSEGLYGGKLDLVRVLDSTIVIVEGGYAFSQVQVFETIPLTWKGTAVPIETVLRPRWMSAAYLNENISKNIYQPFFGCGSVIDHVGTKDENGDEVPITQLPIDSAGIGIEVTENSDEMIQRVTKLRKDSLHYTIEKAVNVITYLYSQVRRQGTFDVDEFINSFVRRPIATKEEVLGSYDLSYVVGSDGVMRVDSADATTNAVEGFHSRALSPVAIDAGNLTGLVDDPANTIARMDKVKKVAMAAAYDVRKAKLDMVRRYKEALDKGRGRVG
jgi:hypothetical protein